MWYFEENKSMINNNNIDTFMVEPNEYMKCITNVLKHNHNLKLVFTFLLEYV